MATVFVTGTSGQDGSYLCEQLLAAGHEVHGLSHGLGSAGRALDGLHHQITWHSGDLRDGQQVRSVVLDVAPTEIYNLAGISSVAQSWSEPELTAQITGLGALSIFDAAAELQQRIGSPVRVVQASSAEIFGSPEKAPQNELTPIRPTSPYGAAKAFAHHLAGVYRHRDLGVSTCILYNHESPRRPLNFVTRKITRTVAEISLGQADKLVLGNLDARRDWGWAPDYVAAMVLANEHAVADDYIVATGEAHSVRDFVEAAFNHVGITDWQPLVGSDPAFMRPADPFELLGDAGKAREQLGWRPSVGFAELVQRMVQSDLDELTG
ncbi:GDPmannose 4,6-dehydratase [Frankineae bacterium MT45]|nr:GDPmannose 4,6-dehydratase [Frankineae bacterium MT45]